MTIACGQFTRNRLTNVVIRRSDEACATEYELDPAARPLLDVAAYTELEPYVRHKGALVGQDVATGYIKPSWLYATGAAFQAEFVGVMDYSLEPKEADCHDSPRKCGGKVVVYSGCVILESLLSAAVEIITNHAIIPYVQTFTPGGNGCHPFMVTNTGLFTHVEQIGKVIEGHKGDTVDIVTWTLV